MSKRNLITGSSLKKSLERTFQVLGKVLYRSFFLCLSLVLFSCDNATSGDYVAKSDNNELALKAFSKEHNALMGSLLTVGKDAVNDPAEVEKIIDEVEANVRNVMSVDDNISIQTRTQAEYAASDLLNSVDIDSFLPSIKGKVSTEFYEICRKVIEEGDISVTEDEIINDKNLSEREKISALLFLPVITNTTLYIEPKTRAPNPNRLKQYQNARTICGVKYVGSCALSCIGGPIGAAIGVAYATYELNNCLNDAYYHYTH